MEQLIILLLTFGAAYRDQPATSASPPTRDKIQTEEKIRTRRVVNREKRGIKSGRSFSEDFSGILPSWRDQKMEEENSGTVTMLTYD